MATFKATDVSNLDASPPIPANVGKLGGRVRIAKGTHEITTAYATSDILVIARLPWNARIDSFQMGWDDLGTTATFDLGWYYPDGTVGDIDEFASALVGGTATVMTEQLFEAAATDLDRMGKTLWEFAGLSTMPQTFNSMVDIALTFSTVSSPSAGTISWRITYTID